MADLDAQYQPEAVPIVVPATDAMLTSDAASGAQAASQVSTIRRMLPTEATSASSKSRSTADDGPALFTRCRTMPSSRLRANPVSTSSGTVTSAVTATARPPSFSISVTVPATVAPSRSHAATARRSSAACTAVARPMPLPAPVTTTTSPGVNPNPGALMCAP